MKTTRSKAKTTPYHKPPTLQDVLKRFPDDEACLRHIFNLRYTDFNGKTRCPKCNEISKFHKLKSGPIYTCQWCGHHIHPMAGTIFHRTRTPLANWFYAIYLFTVSRHGVPANELKRQLGVTYKTAWRIAHKIRELMASLNPTDILSGHVEIDELILGGKTSTDEDGTWASKKMIVFGMVERGGGIRTSIVKDRTEKTLQKKIVEGIRKGSSISSDNWHGYGYLREKGYRHQILKHSNKEYAKGVFHTNTIESFWSRLKNSIKGTHVHVSKKHLEKYLAEFEFRFNYRKKSGLMFEALLGGF